MDNANLYRVGHPLAQRIIEKCKELPTPEAELKFNYTDTGRNIAVIEPLCGKSGWLVVQNLRRFADCYGLNRSLRFTGAPPAFQFHAAAGLQNK